MRKTVLFVDDNPVILKSIENAFSAEGYEVLLAATPEEGLAQIREDSPQVIVSDLRMPRMNGLEFLHAARQRNRHFVGMIFTAHLDIDAIMEAVREEAVWRYIHKPWQDPRELVLTVRNAFQYHEAMTAVHAEEEQRQRAGRLAALGQLVAGISHQFNNINVGILGYVQMALLHPGLPPEVREQLEQVRLFTKRGTDIIRELAAFSDQSRQWGFAVAPLSDTVQEAVSFCHKGLTAEGIELETTYSEPCLAMINVGLVRQLITHLLHNAQHATLGRSPRRITVETGCAGERVFVSISDNGCGIPKESLARIFDPFFTTKGAQATFGSPQAAAPGVGLGLSLSQTVAQAHNGEITVRSTEGQGACFTFSLPAVTPCQSLSPP